MIVGDGPDDTDALASLDVATRRTLAHATLLDEMLDLSNDSDTTSLRDELAEELQERKHDSIIKSAIAKGNLPSADVIEQRLLVDPDRYDGMSAHDAEEQAVVEYLIEPTVVEDDLRLSATSGAKKATPQRYAVTTQCVKTCARGGSLLRAPSERMGRVLRRCQAGIRALAE
jgi:hypothetical protein